MKGCNYEMNERHARMISSGESGQKIILGTSDTSLWQLLPIVILRRSGFKVTVLTINLRQRRFHPFSWVELRRRENDRHAEAGIRLA
jgi:hypothetical protein